ncbi:MAG: hypothetical protein JWO78_1133 [Micavibrio sp.]|nr:hypothetical protein [Micavibrio sp.]
MISHEFSGESTVSYEDAIGLALYAATEFLDNMKDAQVDIKELHQDAAEHYHALLEITKDPLAPAYTEEEFETDDDLSEKQDAEKKLQIYRRKGYPTLKALIADHFKKKGQQVPSGIPDFIIAHLTAVDIENNAIEKDFLFAAEAMPVPIIDEPQAGNNDDSDGDGGDDSRKPEAKAVPEPERVPAAAQPEGL